MYREESFQAQFLEIPSEPDFMKVCLIRPFKGDNVRAPGLFGTSKELLCTGTKKGNCPERVCFRATDENNFNYLMIQHKEK